MGSRDGVLPSEAEPRCEHCSQQHAPVASRDEPQGGILTPDKRDSRSARVSSLLHLPQPGSETPENVDTAIAALTQ